VALKATVFKAELQIVDMDRHYYHDHSLTIAHHPSETDERMMMRLLAALHADESLVFGKRLSTDDEPDLWQKDLTGAIDLWLDVGLPDEKRVRKAAGRAGQVVVYSYGGLSADRWWSQVGSALERVGNLTVMNLPKASSQAMAELAQLSMRLQKARNFHFRLRLLSPSQTPPDRAGPHSSSLCRHATIWIGPISGRVQPSREASSELERPLVYLHRWAKDPHLRRPRLLERSGAHPHRGQNRADRPAVCDKATIFIGPPQFEQTSGSTS
jgi:uncharacterized protein YaeQ